MNEVKHTPLPWRTVKHPQIGYSEIEGVDQYVVATFDPAENVNDEANAAFIVKAVNNHYTLTEQRDELLAVLRLVKYNSDADQFSRIVQDKINAAIAKAEGKS